MTQASNFSVFRNADAPKTGDEVQERLAEMLAALLSSNEGASEPSYAVGGTTWWDEAARSLHVRDNTNSEWVPLIPERGSNAQGEFVRFPDGTQVCYATLPGLAVNTPENAIYRAGARTWTYPAPFSSAPVVTGSACDTYAWLGVEAPGTTTVFYRLLAARSLLDPVVPKLTAVGRWF